MDYTMAQAKRDLKRGMFAGWAMWECAPDLLSGNAGWVIQLEPTAGLEGRGMLVDARSGRPRLFKTSDAAISALRQIGFRAKRVVYGLE